MAIEDPYGRWIAHSRRENELRQQDLADKLGKTVGLIGQFESFIRPVSADLRRQIDRILALGRRRRSDGTPVHVVAEVAKDGTPRILRDREGWIGYFTKPELAELTARFLRGLGLEDACALPIWPSHVEALVEEGSVEGAYHLDEGEDHKAISRRLLAYFAELEREQVAA